MSARVFYYRAKRSMTPEEQVIANTYPNGLDMDRDAFAHNSLIRFSVVRDDDPEKAEIQKMIFETGFEDIKMDRAVGSVLGAPIGDSLGAPLEFSDVRYGSTELQDMGQESVWQKRSYNSFNLKPGQWTDDASMALCCADSLLVSKGFNARDLRLRFLNWYHYGYNNAFGYDDGQRHSIGLGGNISMSMGEFERKRLEYTSAGDRFTSGNGSIMRLSPTPVYYWDDYENALDASYKQSKTTHQGDEAAECCRIMAHIIVTAINHPSEGDVPKSILDDLPETFKTDLYSARCLADSKQEERCEDNKGQDLKDRNWNWKDENFRFSPTRSRQQPGYIGSYAMDGLAMALHCVYTTNSFREACLKSANMRGDADSYTSVTAQLAGAIYGCRAIPKHWIQYVQQWDNNGSIALRAYKLYNKHDL